MSDILKLAKAVEAEHEAFQYHVSDLVRDILTDAEFHGQVMETLSQNLTPAAIDLYIANLPDAPGFTPTSSFMKDLLASYAAAGVMQGDIRQLVAAELIHRRRWDRVMNKYPGTLQAMKDRIK